MRKVALAVVYTALGLGANPAISQDLDALSAARAGDMMALQVHDAPTRSSDTPFLTFDDQEMTLAAFEGQYVVLNFWATWCAPCRVEMPYLSELQASAGGDALQVVTVATGRNAPPAMEAFFDEINVDNLPLYRDPRQALARDMGVLGLPVTIILNTEGQEIARLNGEANWSDANAMAVINALLAN